MTQKTYYLPTFWGVVIFCLTTTQLLAQVTEDVLLPDSVEAQIAAYNKERLAFEYMLKQRECDGDVRALKSNFEADLKLLDSLLAALPLAEIPTNYAGKLIILSSYKPETGCLQIAYAKKKYPKGCGTAFYPDSVNFTPFAHYQKALQKGQLCVTTVEGSGFTQVDKIQNIAITEQSATELLALIKRTTDLYSDVLGVTYAQYVAFEKKKNLKTLAEIISVRVKFLTLSNERIKS